MQSPSRGPWRANRQPLPAGNAEQRTSRILGRIRGSGFSRNCFVGAPRDSERSDPADLEPGGVRREVSRDRSHPSSRGSGSPDRRRVGLPASSSARRPITRPARPGTARGGPGPADAGSATTSDRFLVAVLGVQRAVFGGRMAGYWGPSARILAPGGSFWWPRRRIARDETIARPATTQTNLGVTPD